MKSKIPYPLSATCLSISLTPFSFRVKPEWKYYKFMPEYMRTQGETIWWFRWLVFIISYSRLL